MKNRFRFYLIIAYILALTISGGVYAHTYTTTLDMIGIAEPTGDIATSNTTETQPDWESVLTPVNDTIIYRPEAAGDQTTIEDQYPATGEHWDKVDEETSDGDDTYIATNNSNWKEDLYNITDHSTQTAAGTINYVVVYMVCRSTANSTQLNARIHIKTNGVEYDGTSENVTTSYATYSYQWNNNPQTGQPWTWDEIDALQIGFGLRRPASSEYTRCTQVYAEVDFDAPPLNGNVSTGDLFIVYPYTNYPGDLAVKVYLTNTDNLTKAYKNLDMELYLAGSVEASKTPNYRMLTLENGVATFWLDNAGSDNRTLSVTGGTYTLTSREPLEWEADWTATPELYCEVTQR
ncbi:hypothetical protein ACFLTG_03500 [Chloroflexota bacterium]